MAAALSHCASPPATHGPGTASLSAITDTSAAQEQLLQAVFLGGLCALSFNAATFHNGALVWCTVGQASAPRHDVLDIARVPFLLAWAGATGILYDMRSYAYALCNTKRLAPRFVAACTRTATASDSACSSDRWCTCLRPLLPAPPLPSSISLRML